MASSSLVEAKQNKKEKRGMCYFLAPFVYVEEQLAVVEFEIRLLETGTTSIWTCSSPHQPHEPTPIRTRKFQSPSFRVMGYVDHRPRQND
jgi:hypothetical protein